MSDPVEIIVWTVAIAIALGVCALFYLLLKNTRRL